MFLCFILHLLSTGGCCIIFSFPWAVMGSLEHSLSSLSLDGALRADGESFGEDLVKQKDNFISKIGPGGGSGGTILLFVNTLALGSSSTISTVGGHGSPYGGGGGGGGRIHFHWSEISTGDAYIPVSSVNGSIIIGYVCFIYISYLITITSWTYCE